MNRKIKILLIEDDEEDYLITKDIIEDISGNKYQLIWASTYEAGIREIHNGGYDIYLVDYRLGKESGLELLRTVSSEGKNIPFILLTGVNDIELDIEAMEAGAADFLIKGQIVPKLLERSIRYAIKLGKTLERLKQSEASLEEKVNLRTADLLQSEQKLREALSTQMELNQLKSRFVSMASHEFRTPLTSILSSVSIIKRYAEKGMPKKQDKHILRIQNSVKNLTSILNDFLSLEKLESGKVNLNILEIDLTEFVQEITEDLEPILKEGQLIHHAHTGKNKIMQDPHLLKNILFNLLSNAIKYSPNGESVTINSNTANQKLLIEVIDQGLGIPLEDHKHMFTRFFRANNVTNIKGTGLGLTIVKRYINLMGGEISFKSTPGEGTCFMVNIPQQT